MHLTHSGAIEQLLYSFQWVIVASFEFTLLLTRHTLLSQALIYDIHDNHDTFAFLRATIDKHAGNDQRSISVESGLDVCKSRENGRYRLLPVS